MGGANLVITGSTSRKQQLNREYQFYLVVHTSHWKELSWLINTLNWYEKINWQVDYTNKHFVLNQLGEAAFEDHREHPNDVQPNGIYLSILYRAYKIFTSDFNKNY
jgi:hypothetical protein